MSFLLRLFQSSVLETAAQLQLMIVRLFAHQKFEQIAVVVLEIAVSQINLLIETIFVAGALAFVPVAVVVSDVVAVPRVHADRR